MTPRLIFLLFLLLLSPAVFSQQELTLAECYTLAEQNYPMVRQRALISSGSGYSVKNIQRGFLPQVSVNGQATYQSDVTSVPVKIPGMEITPPSKEQYKIYAEISQVVYDGGLIRQQQALAQENGVAEEKKLEVELYKVRERVNELFFGILLLDEQLAMNQLLEKDIEAGIAKTKGGVEYGTVLKSQLDVLLAERLRLQQRSIDLHAARNSFIDMLSIFINKPLTPSVALHRPAEILISDEISRPELELFKVQQSLVLLQDKAIKSRNRPRFSLFLQSGLGRPALNMLSNEAEAYYIGGIRMSFPLFHLYTSRNDRALVLNQKQAIDIQQDLFLFNTRLSVSRQKGDVDRLGQLLSKDDELIQLRTSIKTAALSQLENGVITSSDYLREVIAENQARQNRSLHVLQLLQSQYALSLTIGHHIN